MIIGYIIVAICCLIGFIIGLREMADARQNPRPVKKEEKQGDIYLYIDMK